MKETQKNSVATKVTDTINEDITQRISLINKSRNESGLENIVLSDYLRDLIVRDLYGQSKPLVPTKRFKFYYENCISREIIPGVVFEPDVNLTLIFEFSSIEMCNPALGVYNNSYAKHFSEETLERFKKTYFKNVDSLVLNVTDGYSYRFKVFEAPDNSLFLYEDLTVFDGEQVILSLSRGTFTKKDEISIALINERYPYLKPNEVKELLLLSPYKTSKEYDSINTLGFQKIGAN